MFFIFKDTLTLSQLPGGRFIMKHLPLNVKAIPLLLPILLLLSSSVFYN